MGGADREMLSDEIGEEHEEAADDVAGVELPLRAPPGLPLAAAHRNLLLPPPSAAALCTLCSYWLSCF